jgi:hypothetical protein
MLVVLNDAGYVHLQFLFPFGRNKAKSILYGKNELDVQLCVRVWHNWVFFGFESKLYQNKNVSK